MAFVRALDLVRQKVPDMDSRIRQFEVEEFDIDDDLISAFCEELERLTTDLKNGWDASDVELARKSAHSLKGMCGTMGLPEISVLSQEIEFTLRAGELERSAELSRILIKWAADWIAAPMSSDA